MSAFLVYLGAGIIVLWGLGHLFATRPVVAGFGVLAPDNRRVIIMEWVAEGMTLVFLGILAALAQTLAAPRASTLILVAAALMLLALAVLSGFTGARTSVMPMKLCPVVKTTAAALFLISRLI